ncbi:hypothetical protein VX037_14895 [Gordonia sp. Z-3]|uniref:Uncharacterized protein n=2 Tax=Gordonia TaxID=2053 RepID=A0A9X3D5K6_9ACTN|nr:MULTISPECIES: hypothetical protein [Gordonia]MCF3940138.1 hypothetical protein [Gordonia tangerina]MCX2965345.1 hypothetical protein [Gordonia aquimaris]MED5802320.1 hypothetical protein [Gordonia sp. Z-3]
MGWVIVAIILTVWVTVAVVLALVIGRSVWLRDRNEKPEPIPHVDPPGSRRDG